MSFIPVCARAALAFAFAFAALSVPARAAPKDNPDSLRAVLDLAVDDVDVEEVAFGAGLTHRLYSTQDQTRLVWRRDDTRFVYVIEGPGHVAAGAALSARIEKHGVASAVVDVKPYKTERFQRYRRVLALQVRVPPPERRR